MHPRTFNSKFLSSANSFGKICVCLFLLLSANAAPSLAQSGAPLLLRDPSISKTQIAFAYAGSIWTANRDASDVRRLTAGGHESKPIFSPDGSLIAFTGEYDGTRSVYVVPVTGGEPRRLTYHPNDYAALGWTPDGKRILFVTGRTAFAGAVTQLFTVPVEGGFASPVPLVRASQGSFSPDASRIAYVFNIQWQQAWKRYRGGQTMPIWIAGLADSAYRAPSPATIPTTSILCGSATPSISCPIAMAPPLCSPTTSNRNRSTTREERRPRHQIRLRHVRRHHLRTVWLAPHLDPTSGSDRALDIRPVADLAEVRPHFRKIDVDHIQSGSISPTGARAVFSARGEIFTVPGEKGDVRDMTNTPDVVERDPAWSPDGKSIAYFPTNPANTPCRSAIRTAWAKSATSISANRPRSTTPPVVARLQEDCVHRQATEHLVRGPREKPPVHVDSDTYTDPRHGYRSPGRRTVTGSRIPDSSRAISTQSSFIRSTRTRPSSSPMV